MPSEPKKPEPFGYVSDFKQAGIMSFQHAPWDQTHSLFHSTSAVFTDAQLEQYAADRVREAEEAIADEYASRLQSDLEHGVRSLNEAAADTFRRVYPQLAGFMGWLNDRTLKEQTK